MMRGKPTAAARRRLKLRSELFNDVPDEALWSRGRFVGFTTVPRTMPLIMRIIDALDAKKAGRVYFDLWCKAFEDFFVEVKDEDEAAYASGYSGQRAVRSWRERMAVLERFGFIMSKQTNYGAYRYVLIVEPHAVIERLSKEGLVSQDDQWSLRSLMISIGALTD